MAIVTRRSLQQLLFQLRSVTDRERRVRLAAALNRGDDESLSAEWEILVLSALAWSADVEHEPLLGTRRPDIFARVGSEPPFVADIAAVSEAGYHERNPLRQFTDAVLKQAYKAGLSGHGIEVQVEGELEGARGRQQMDLLLPNKAELRRLLNSEVKPFLEECASAPSEPRILNLTGDRQDIRISYTPGRSFFSMSHPSFTTYYSTTRNAVFNVLKRKAAQLREAQFEGPCGVILCSAGADLRDHQHAGKGLGQITKEFFRQNLSISFVLTCWVSDASDDSGRYESHLYLNPSAKAPLPPKSAQVLESMSFSFPRPRRNATNALNYLRFCRERGTLHYNRPWTMNHSTIKISSRLLMDYLAGRVTPDEFLASCGGAKGFVPFFEHKLRSGQLLVAAGVQPRDDEDDDWVVFHFGPPDPAVVPFRP